MTAIRNEKKTESPPETILPLVCRLDTYKQILFVEGQIRSNYLAYSSREDVHALLLDNHRVSHVLDLTESYTKIIRDFEREIRAFDTDYRSGVIKGMEYETFVFNDHYNMLAKLTLMDLKLCGVANGLSLVQHRMRPPRTFKKLVGYIHWELNAVCELAHMAYVETRVRTMYSLISGAVH